MAPGDNPAGHPLTCWAAAPQGCSFLSTLSLPTTSTGWMDLCRNSKRLPRPTSKLCVRPPQTNKQSSGASWASEKSVQLQHHLPRKRPDSTGKGLSPTRPPSASDANMNPWCYLCFQPASYKPEVLCNPHTTQGWPPEQRKTWDIK